MSTFRDHLLAITSREPPPIEKLWEKTGFTPNDAQRAAILHADGPLYLTAGPGSGKTRVLLWRTVNLIVYHGVRPEEIFLSTFTEKAARQLSDGLRSLLGLVTNLTGQPYDLAGMYLGTVHSLCQRMLSDRRRFFADRHRPRPPTRNLPAVRLPASCAASSRRARSKTPTRLPSCIHRSSPNRPGA